MTPQFSREPAVALVQGGLVSLSSPAITAGRSHCKRERERERDGTLWKLRPATMLDALLLVRLTSKLRPRKRWLGDVDRQIRKRRGLIDEMVTMPTSA